MPDNILFFACGAASFITQNASFAGISSIGSVYLSTFRQKNQSYLSKKRFRLAAGSAAFYSCSSCGGSSSAAGSSSGASGSISGMSSGFSSSSSGKGRLPSAFRRSSLRTFCNRVRTAEPEIPSARPISLLPVSYTHLELRIKN